MGIRTSVRQVIQLRPLRRSHMCCVTRGVKKWATPAVLTLGSGWGLMVLTPRWLSSANYVESIGCQHDDHIYFSTTSCKWFVSGHMFINIYSKFLMTFLASTILLLHNYSGLKQRFFVCALVSRQLAFRTFPWIISWNIFWNYFRISLSWNIFLIYLVKYLLKQFTKYFHKILLKGLTERIWWVWRAVDPACMDAGVGRLAQVNFTVCFTK